MKRTPKSGTVLSRDPEGPHDIGEEYGVAPAIPHCRFTWTNLFCHSSLHRLPSSMPVNPFTTDQNPIFPTPRTLNNGDIMKFSPSTGATKHISMNSRRPISCFLTSMK